MLMGTRSAPGRSRASGARRRARTSIEFADYRNYVRGDDCGASTGIFARLDRPFIKLLEDEEDLAVYLLLDASGSMDWPRSGDRDRNKFLYARRVLAGLAYVALGGGDRVSIHALRPDTPARWGPLRGRGQTLSLLAWLEGASAGGAVELNAALREVALRAPRAGLGRAAQRPDVAGGVSRRAARAPGPGARGCGDPGALAGRGHAGDHGDLKLIDVETGTPQDVTIDSEIRDLYMQRFEAWQNDIARPAFGVACISRRSRPARLEQLILAELRRLGVGPLMAAIAMTHRGARSPRAPRRAGV